jgi:hypothetical protein
MKKPILLNAGPSERGWHRLESGARCLRLYAYQNVLGMSFPLSEPLVNGSLLHIGLAHHYQRLQAEQSGWPVDQWYTPEEAIERLADKSAVNCSSAIERELWLSAAHPIIQAYRAYRQNYGADSGYKVVSVENELRARIGKEKWLYTQRADLVMEDAAGKIWFWDHKSAYRIAAKTLRPHILNGQMLGYRMFGRQMYGERFGGVLLNRVKVRPPYQFDRSPVEAAPAALSRFTKNIVQIENRIQEYEGRPFEEWPGAYSDLVCTHKYGPCDAFEVCQWGLPEEE